MDNYDVFLEPITTVYIEAPFRPIGYDWMKPLRAAMVGIMKALGLRKNSQVPIVVEEMDFARTGKYLMTLLNCVKVVSEGLRKSTDDPVGALTNMAEDNYKINKIAPSLFVIATGINDLEFFSSLKPTEASRLEVAIESVNPTIAEFKKKLSLMWKMLAMEIEDRPNKQTGPNT